jgi:hypothetical protein
MGGDLEGTMAARRKAEGIEFTATATHRSDGCECDRCVGVRGFWNALKEHGGRAPIGRNGKPQLWRAELGFHDDLRDITDATAHMLSPAARARREARRLEEFDFGILHDVLVGRRAHDERVVRESKQRQVARELAASRMRLLGRS